MSPVPEWSRNLFNEYLKHNEKLRHVLELSVNGIHMLRGRAEAIRVLEEIKDGEPDPDYEEKLGYAERQKELAQYEVDNDFPLLHEQATVALWSSLEALVRSFVALLLEISPDAAKAEEVLKLRVRLGDFQSLDPEERCLWIVDQLDQSLSGPLKNGINRFESLLKPFGLSGSFDKAMTQQLYELSQIRHVIVHRSGVADLKFLDACPWLGFKKGQRVNISSDMWNGYNHAVSAYVLELIQRTREFHGVPRFVSGGEPEAE